MFKSILLPVDLNQESSWSRALPVAIKIARDEGAELHVATVIPDFGMSMVGSFFPADFAKNALADTKKALVEFVAEKVPEDVKVSCHARNGTIYKAILEAAKELDADLIVLSSHRPETKDYLLGPNAARIVRHATQSVFVMRGE